jgi:ribonuclease P/MRP protein subunit POP1
MYIQMTGNGVKDKPSTSQKGKESAVGTVKTSPAADVNRQRTLWLRIHPVIFEDVIRELQKATTQFLAQPRSSAGEIAVEIADLRGQINTFEIMGPKSSQVLKGTLFPVLDEDRVDFKKVSSCADSWSHAC